MKDDLMNKIFAILLCACVAATANARSVVDFFKSADADSAIPLLSKNTRLDMYDYFSSGMPHYSTNNLDGTARITDADNASMRFESTSDIKCQLAMLTAGSDTVLMLIETLHLPQADSHITLYSKNWTPLKREAFAEPKLADWLTATGKANRADVEAWLPFLLWKADYADGVLTLTNTLSSYYADPKDTANLSAWLLPTLTYTYNGKKFTRKK
jgi:hypothetical protein